MTEKDRNNLYYVCSLIEFVARKTKNSRKDMVAYFDENAMEHLLNAAEVNHCLSFEQVSDELIEEYGICEGTSDSVAECKYEVPYFLSIGLVYEILISEVCGENESIAKKVIEVFSSFISDEISDFNSSVYYSNPDYLKQSYLEGRLLA